MKKIQVQPIIILLLLIFIAAVIINNYSNDNLQNRSLPNITIGLIADVHCCNDAEGKKGSNAIPFLNEIIDLMNTNYKPDIIILLGDYTNEASTVNDLKAVRTAMNNSTIPFYFVRGNHDNQITDEQYKSGLSINYTNISFDYLGYHFILLDGVNNTQNGGYPIEKIEWAKADLKNTQLPTLFFMHSPADGQNLTGNKYFTPASENRFVDQQIALRRVLYTSKKVVAVYSGHYHWNNFVERDGIPYFTIPSLVESNRLNNAESEKSYAITTISNYDISTVIFSNGGLGRNYSVRPHGSG